jgi:hypothetical protein
MALIANLASVSFGTVSRTLAAAGTVSGNVYHDYNGNGIKNGASAPFGADEGIAGVAVRAYDSTGALVGAATTVADGTYSISVTGAATTSVRIEFDTPPGFFPSPSNPGAVPYTQAVNSTRPGPIQFTTVPRSLVDYALTNGEIGESTDRIAAVQMRRGPTTYSPTVDSIWLTNNVLTSPTTDIANSGETGALWGLAWNRTNQRLWSSAVIRRSSGLGPKGIGGLYMVDVVGGTTNVIASFDLRDYGVVLENVTSAGGTDYDDSDRDLSGPDQTKYWDIPGYSGVGTEGFGDIDFSKDDRYLYVVNLYERKIHRFTMGGTANAPTLNDHTDFSVPDTHCTSPSIARPWGIEVMEEGVLNVGVICTDMVSGTAALTARPAPEKGSILRLDPVTGGWSELATIDLSYYRNTHYSGLTGSGAVMAETTTHWQEWTNDYVNIDAIGSNQWNLFDWSQPIISDIETVKGGGMMLGLTNRFNFQTGPNLVQPDPTKTTTKIFDLQMSSGDTLFMCRTATGWSQDKNSDCKTNADWVGDDLLHRESSLGALAAYSPALTHWVASSAMDPGGYPTAGVWQNNVATGGPNASVAYQPNDFNKGAAMGDIEILNLNAPVSIGNRLWYDADGDGIQDAGELPIVGATVRLYNSAGTLAGTAITNANGEYYFASNVAEVAAGNGDFSGGGLTAGEEFTVRVDNAANFSSGPLQNYALTAPNKSDSASSLDDEIDSDASLVSGYPRITVPAMEWGQSNMSYDIGFAPVVSIGDRVWLDTDRDAVQDVGEVGLAGVTVTLTYADGSPVYDASGNLVTTAVTDSNGNYLFPNLLTAPAGTYKVTMTTPSGYGRTTPISDTSLALTTAGASDLTLDFGVAPAVSVGDLVWVDTDRDGIQDDGEPGIAGVTMSITKADGTAVTDVSGNVVTTATTDANGNYVFANLPPGSYKVTAVTPSGYVSTSASVGSDPAVDSSTGTATSATLTNPGSSDMSLDFGFVLPRVLVGDYVWLDTDRDGIQDDGESGIAGVTMSITKADGTAVTDVFGNAVPTTTTDANGNYVFSNLPPGSYKVTATTPSGYVATTAVAGSDRGLDSSSGFATSTNLAADGASDLTLDFGFVVPSVSVGNLVWKDTDRDGVQDGGEPGIAGVTMSITKADGTAVTDVFGNAVPTTTTDANGNYVFSNLPPGSYKVTATTPSGYVATTAVAGSDRGLDSSSGFATSTNLAADGASDLTLDFGFVVPSVSVGNLVWKDTDRDGVQDGGEPGIAGVTMSITKADGTAVTDVFGNAVPTTTTDANGNYLFANLPVGSYKVTAVTPTGYIATTATAGSDRGLDSSTGFATSGTLSTDGASDLTLDFGFREPKVAVGDFVWFDTDRDGVQDVGEPGIAGVTLSITKADGTAVTDVFGNAVTTTMTDTSGHYLFENLPPGSYKVSVVNPSGFTATVAGSGTTASDSSTGDATSTNLVTDSASDLTLDFGFFAPMVSVGNRVWIDTDRDGVQDVGESGIAGVTLSITKADGTAVTDVFGNAVTTTTTDANGNYLFANLPVGSYKVTAATPSGYVATTEAAGSDRGLDSSTEIATSTNLATDGASDLTLDFGFVVPSVSVGNLVWKDIDVDGVQDVGEPGIAGVTLSITKADGTAVTDVFGNAVTTTTTDANGNYLFANLPVGSYKVTATTPSGLVATTAAVGSDRGLDSSTGFATSNTLSTNGASDLTLDFGFRDPMVAVGDFVWFDTDRDGVQDVGEPGIAGVTLSITKADGTAVTDVFGNAVKTTTTDASGNYLFANLPFGSYKVSVVNPTGYTATVAGAGTTATDSSTGNATSTNLVTDSASDLTLDFGFFAPMVSVGNLVWIDTDRDGVQDVGESGIAGVTLSITKADGTAVTDVFGNAVTSTTSDANGNYLFANLPVGSYKVTAVAPSGHVATTATAGSDRGADSSTDYATSTSLMTDSASDLTLDFGFVEPMVSVGNLVWIDTDRDGVQDVGEPGIAGVTLSITKADGTAVTDVFGNAVTTTTTDANGNYLFANLPLGSYKVTATTPSGYVATTAVAGSDRGADSSTDNATSTSLMTDSASDLTLDFGFVVPKVVDSSSPEIPRTGTSTLNVLLVAFVQLMIGSVLILFARRRSHRLFLR